MKLKTLFVKLISLYQKFLSPFIKSGCVFYPTCSVYAQEAILKHGALKGIYLGILRIFKCHPWQKNHIDPLK